MVSVEAAGADAGMRAGAGGCADATHRVHLALTERLPTGSALRDGLDPVTAADILYALGSPHMHQLLRRHRGWSVERYSSRLQNAIIRELID
jgi:hypothetical protein